MPSMARLGRELWLQDGQQLMVHHLPAAILVEAGPDGTGIGCREAERMHRLFKNHMPFSQLGWGGWG